MKLHARLLHMIAGLGVAVVLGLLLSSCGGTTPNAPTTPPVGVSGSTSGTSSSFAGTTTSWSCLTAGSAGIFGSAAGCGPSGIHVSSQGRITALAAPGPSANLSGSVNGSTVTLNWLAPTAADPATSYVIEAGSSSGATNIAVFDTGSAATTLTVTGVPAGTYFVRVRAKNSSGSSAPSNEIVLTVGGGPPPCTTAPGVPTGLSAAVSSTSVTLTWSAPSGGCPPSTYGVEAGSTSGASNLASVSTNSTGTSFTASDVPAGTYFVRVRAGNGSSFGSPSNEVVVTVGSAPPPPPPPGSGVTGRWVGLVANGDGLTGSSCGGERWDWQLDLTQTGTTVTGTLTQKTVVSGCVDEDPIGEVKTAPVTGTAGSGTFSFTISPADRPLPGSATFTASRMTGTVSRGSSIGSFAVNKQ